MSDSLARREVSGSIIGMGQFRISELVKTWCGYRLRRGLRPKWQKSTSKRVSLAVIYSKDYGYFQASQVFSCDIAVK